MTTKVEANYRRSEDPKKACSVCRNFTPGPSQAAGTCEVVEGQINPKAVCDLFDPGPDAKGPMTPEALDDFLFGGGNGGF